MVLNNIKSYKQKMYFREIIEFIEMSQMQRYRGIHDFRFLLVLPE